MKPRYDPRVFLALTLSRTAQERMAQIQAELKQYMANWHFTPLLNFHVTLRFFGETPEEDISRIDSACKRLAKRNATAILNWNHLGFFGPPQAARVLYLGTTACPELERLAADVMETFPDERERRRYRPHVTLAKARKHMEPGLARMNANMLRRLQELGRIGPEPIAVDISTVHREFVMMETDWVGRRAEYHIRERYALKAAE